MHVNHIGEDHPQSAAKPLPPQAPPRRQAMAGGKLAGPNVDFVKLAWKSKWLLLLGLIAGLGGGYYHYIQSPEMYRSAARVQIIESSIKNLPGEGLDGGRSAARSLADEALVMRSERILRQAAELGELSLTPEFAGLPNDSIGSMLAGSASLAVGPAVEAGSTSVFSIRYDSTSGLTSQRVVQGVIDAYAAHLQEQYRNIGQETLTLIESARTDVLAKLSLMEDEFEQFKRESGLIFRDGVIRSIHRDNADRYLAQQQSLLIQQAKLNGSLKSASRAMESDRPVESVLMALQDSAAQLDANAPERIAAQVRDEKIELVRESGQLKLSEQLRQNKLLPLELERQDIADSFGADHPAIKTVLNRIRVVEQTIAEIAATEQGVADRLAAIRNDDQTEIPEVNIEESLRDRVQLKIYAMQQTLDTIDEELQLINAAYASEIEQARDESSLETRTAQFQREISRQQELYNRIVERLDEVNLLSESGGLKVFPLDTAKLGYQFAPSMSKSLLMGGFLGCMLAAGLAFLREVSDRSYHSAREIAEHIRLPVIGHVPALKKQTLQGDFADSKLDPRLYAYFNTKGSKAESFRAIRTALYFSNQSRGDQVLQVTSPTPGDGKSTIAANLAISIAQSGRSVLLIDADLRRPRIQKLFGMEVERGLAWVIAQAGGKGLVGELPYAEAIHVTEVDNLSVMLAGERPDNPAELLASAAFEQLLDSLRCKFDMIIIDTPPLLAVSDPSNVVRRVDGVLLVVRLRKNIKPAVAQASRMLETLEANVLGVVVNGVGSRQARGYGKESDSEGYYNYGPSYKYGYGYGYGSSHTGEYAEYYDEPSTKSKSRRSKSKSLVAQAAGDPSSDVA